MNQRLMIDVTKIEPRFKHPTIFSSFDGLEAGAAILLHNDHDPKPLYYQLLAERGNCFTWQYEKSGPMIWEVEIRKNLADKQVETIGEIVAKDIRKANVFIKYGLDYCCGGKKTLEDACKEKGLDVIMIKDELRNLETTTTSNNQLDFNNFTCSFLIDYIINVHHTYVIKNMPILTDLIDKVADHHGDSNPELLSIKEKVTEIVNELTVHLKKEEHILFPYIKQLELSKKDIESKPTGFASIQSPIAVMEQDHEFVGKLSEDIRQLTNNYTLPPNACNSYAVLYSKIEEFENDLHTHIHLENNILFPKSLILEKS